MKKDYIDSKVNRFLEESIRDDGSFDRALFKGNIRYVIEVFKNEIRKTVLDDIPHKYQSRLLELLKEFPPQSKEVK